MAVTVVEGLISILYPYNDRDRKFKMQDSGIEFDMASLADADQVLSDDKHFYQLNSKPIAQRFVNI